MKKYLCIHTGSRGEIDDVSEIDGANVEQVVTDTYNDFAYWYENKSVILLNEPTQEDIEDWKRYVEEFGLFDKRDWGWVLGLGEEDGEYYIDMTQPAFLEWEKEIRSKFSTDEFEWTEVSDADLYDLIDLFY